MGTVIATAPPDDDPVHYKITNLLIQWLPLPQRAAEAAARFLGKHLVSEKRRAAIVEQDRTRAIQVLHEDGLLIGQWPNHFTYIPGRFLIAAQVDEAGRSVTITFGTRPTRQMRLRASHRGTAMATALNHYANNCTHQNQEPSSP